MDFNLRETEKFLKRALKKKVSFSNDLVIKYLMMGVLGISLSVSSFAKAVVGNYATDSRDWSNTVVGDNAKALSINANPRQDANEGTESVVIGYNAQTVYGGHSIDKNLGNASHAVVIGAQAKGVEGAIAVGYKTNVSKLYGVGIGRDATVGGEYAVAIGSNEEANKTKALGTASSCYWTKCKCIR